MGGQGSSPNDTALLTSSSLPLPAKKRTAKRRRRIDAGAASTEGSQLPSCPRSALEVHRSKRRRGDGEDGPRHAGSESVDFAAAVDVAESAIRRKSKRRRP